MQALLVKGYVEYTSKKSISQIPRNLNLLTFKKLKFILT